MLRQRQPHRQDSVQQAKHHARECSHPNACPKRRTQVNREPAGEGAGHQNAFNAQVQHPGALTHQHPQRAQNQRRGDAQHGNPEGRVDEDVKQVSHFQRSRYWVSRVATSTAMREVATITSAM